ncbi:hypothetical protein AGLY_015110 [Aphis glycines]|uniref:Uncharacterized protein n=1 Tax=Aphis glycines TaxID=307491 RepID=A0A6G0T1Z5_APHGL|nr:hypothetical protein AGLY_015110 [Aphis glycines]
MFLPSSFLNKLKEEKLNYVEIHSNLKTINGIKQWVEEFGLLTKTQWISRSSIPSGTKILCSKIMVNYTSLIMAPIPKRIKLSGAYYRKLPKEKKEKLDKTIKNSNRVDKMFHQLNNSIKNSYTDGLANDNCSSSNMQMYNENKVLQKHGENPEDVKSLHEITLNEENKITQKCGNNSDDDKSMRY